MPQAKESFKIVCKDGLGTNAKLIDPDGQEVPWIRSITWKADVNDPAWPNAVAIIELVNVELDVTVDAEHLNK